MVIVDFNNVLFAHFFASVGTHTNIEIGEQQMRIMILNVLKGIRKKFPNDNKFIIATDSATNWRKDYFPEYKMSRKKIRDSSDTDWSAIYKHTKTILQEIKENFPYIVIQVDGCEADDIIGVIASEMYPDNITIVSSDKDFRQLQSNRMVEQFDHIKNEYITEQNPLQYLHDHIISGDPGDGVPNVMSANDVFVTGTRQTVMTKKRRAALHDVQNQPNDKYYENWLRNRMLIDLTQTPIEQKHQILDQLVYGPEVFDKSRLMGYISRHRLTHLLEHLTDF